MRDKEIHFVVSQEDLDRIRLKMSEMEIQSLSAYLRKMALDGYCVKLDLKDVKEMINKGLGGAAGAMAGLASGAFAAGLTADNKMLIAGTLAGAHVGSSAADSLMKFGDTTYNNNIKVLVKDGITNKDIIKNTAQIAKSQNWSEDKMKMVAKMAEKYPNLEKDIDKQQELTKEFRDAGLKNDRLIKSAIRDVMKVQKGLDETNKNTKEQNKSDKNIKNWK